MMSSSDYDSEILEAYTTASSYADLISDYNSESSSRQEHQINESDNEEKNEQEEMENMEESNDQRT